MAPQNKDTIDDSDDSPDYRTFTAKPYPPFPMASATDGSVASSIASADYPWTPHGPPKNGRPSRPPSVVTIVITPSAWIATTKATPYAGGIQSSQLTPEPFTSTEVVPTPSFTSVNYGHGRPGWSAAKDRMSKGGVLAATAITPVVVLAFIGGFVFLCMRKRKRRKEETEAAENKVQEMKMQPQLQPYMAGAPSASPSYASTPSHLMPPPNPSAPPPIILGPIPSGANGAYFTGIDTSDVVSMTSANNLRPGPLGFSDGDSLTEPPPPYRPRSAAPPSLTNTSRHSSVRTSVALHTISQTYLIERSPFDDPEDDDVVSDLSGPTAGRSEDAMSAVSDLSYQNEPVVNRSSL
jgi:hypothetical protein